MGPRITLPPPRIKAGVGVYTFSERVESPKSTHHSLTKILLEALSTFDCNALKLKLEVRTDVTELHLCVFEFECQNTSALHTEPVLIVHREADGPVI